MICWQCENETDSYCKLILTNGDVQIYNYCITCKERSGQPMPKDQMADSGISFYVEDNRIKVPRCYICGREGTELHHLFPTKLRKGDLVELDPDGARWEHLTVYLCKLHHKIWHLKVTPNLVLPQHNSRKKIIDYLKGLNS